MPVRRIGRTSAKNTLEAEPVGFSTSMNPAKSVLVVRLTRLKTTR